MRTLQTLVCAISARRCLEPISPLSRGWGRFTMNVPALPATAARPRGAWERTALVSLTGLAGSMANLSIHWSDEVDPWPDHTLS